MKDITRDPTFGGKLEQGEASTIQKGGVTVSVVFKRPVTSHRTAGREQPYGVLNYVV